MSWRRRGDDLQPAPSPCHHLSTFQRRQQSLLFPHIHTRREANIPMEKCLKSFEEVLTLLTGSPRHDGVPVDTAAEVPLGDVPRAGLAWTGRKPFVRRLGIAVAAFGVGLGVRALLDVLSVGLSLPVAAGISVIVVVAVGRVLVSAPLTAFGPVDWATATAYLQERRHVVPEETQHVLAAFMARVLTSNSRRIKGIYPFFLPCPDGRQDGGCDHG
ncbi:hypothetical protein [Sphaerisporangium sp. NPDC051011]|uniref:hypothetical protein n=1 Tax=Sphaerisporangium sp. NPDC051011 TaxID=3155792 RepID=UPI0033CD6730